MYISPKEHARLRYRSRAIDRMLEIYLATGSNREQAFWDMAYVLESFRIEREKRIAQAKKETPCPRNTAA